MMLYWIFVVLLVSRVTTAPEEWKVYCPKELNPGPVAIFKDLENNVYTFNKRDVFKITSYRSNGYPVVAKGYPKPTLEEWPKLDTSQGLVTVFNPEGKLVYFFFPNGKVEVLDIQSESVVSKTRTDKLFKFIARPEGLFFAVTAITALSKSPVIVCGGQAHCAEPGKIKGDLDRFSCTGSAAVFYRVGCQLFRGNSKQAVEHFVDNLDIKSLSLLETRLGVHKIAHFREYLGNIFYYNSLEPKPLRDILDLRKVPTAPIAGQTWIGCPQSFCVSGDIDALTQHFDGTIILFRGPFFWRLKSWPPNGQLQISTANKITSLGLKPHMDAAFTTAVTGNNVTYFLKDDMYWIRSASGQGQYHKIADLFKDTPEHIDAVFWDSGHSTAYVFKDSLYYSYRLTSGVQFERFVDNNPTEIHRLSGLPAKLDAALYLDKETSYFFKGSFNYKFSMDHFEAKGNRFNATLSQESLFQCPDAFYSPKHFQTSIGVSTFEQFKDFMKQFVPQPAKPRPTDQTSATTTSSPASKDTRAADAEKKPFWAIFLITIGCLTLIVIGIFAIALYIFSKSNSTSINSTATSATSDTSMSSGFSSASNSGITSSTNSRKPSAIGFASNSDDNSKVSKI